MRQRHIARAEIKKFAELFQAVFNHMSAFNAYESRNPAFLTSGEDLIRRASEHELGGVFGNNVVPYSADHLAAVLGRGVGTCMFRGYVCRKENGSDIATFQPRDVGAALG